MKTRIIPATNPCNRQTRKISRLFGGANVLAWALAAGLICLVAPRTLHAVSGTWTGGGSDGLWNNTLNWSGGTVANGNSSATFNAAVSNNNITLESGHSLKFIFFDTSTGSYTIGGSSLTLFTGGNITLQSTATGTNLVETINAPISFSTGVYTFTNNRADAGSRLVVGGNITNSGAATLTVNGTGTGSNEISGIISDGGGTQAVTKSGATTWTLSGANTYSGATTVSAGMLTLSNALALQNSALDTTASIAGTSTAGLKTTVTTLTMGGLTGNKSLASVFTTTSGGYSGVTALTLNPGTGVTNSYSGVIADGASGMTLTKTGLGTQALAGANTYTGATLVSAGTLLINSTNTGSAVTVSNTNSTLGGTGTITPGASHALTVNTGAILAPGISGTAGTLTVALNNSGDSATFASGAKFAFDLNAPGTADVLAFTGLTLNVHDVTFNSNVVNFTNLGGLATGTYTLFTFDQNNAFTGTLTIGTGLESFTGSSFSYNANSIVLNVVPEPGTCALLAFTLTTGMVLRRRRSR